MGKTLRRILDCDDTFRALWGSDLSLKAIGAQLQVSHEQVRRIAKEAGLPARHRRVAPDTIDRKMLGDLWAKGVPYAEIAERCGISESKLEIVRVEMGLTTRRNHLNLDAIKEDALLDAWFSSDSAEAVFAGLGVSIYQRKRLRAHFDLPNRIGFGRASATHLAALRSEYIENRRAASSGAAKKAPTMVVVPGGRGRWALARDMKLRKTAGRYAALADLAQELELPLTAVQARWHRVRMAA